MSIACAVAVFGPCAIGCESGPHSELNTRTDAGRDAAGSEEHEASEDAAVVGGSDAGDLGPVAGRAGADGAGTDGAGSGASGSTGGIGGNPFACSPPTPVCGDGRAETSGPGDFICSEECDGEDLKDTTCDSMHYAGGLLGCDAECRFDSTGCIRCPGLDEQLVSCSADATMMRSRPAIAATDTEVAVVWTEVLGVAMHTTMFERFAPDLTPLGEPVELDGVPGPCAMIATPTGWMVASRSSSVDVYVLDGAGRIVSELAVADATSSTSGSAADSQPPTLVARAGSDPLLLWHDSARGVRIALVAADGSRVVALDSLESIDLIDNVGVTAVDDGFVLVGPSDEGNVVAIHVDGSGKQTGPFVIGVGEFPTTATTSDGGIAVVYLASFRGNWHPAWAKLDPSGDPVSGPTKLEPFEPGYGPAPSTLLPLDDGAALITVSGYTPIDAEGVTLAETKRIYADPNVFVVRATRRGPDIVVAWASPFGMARLVP